MLIMHRPAARSALSMVSIDLRHISAVLQAVSRAWSATSVQGLLRVYFSASRERFTWDSGCIYGLFKGCSAGVRFKHGVFRVCLVSGTSRVQLESGREKAPADHRTP